MNHPRITKRHAYLMSVVGDEINHCLKTDTQLSEYEWRVKRGVGEYGLSLLKKLGVVEKLPSFARDFPPRAKSLVLYMGIKTLAEFKAKVKSGEIKPGCIRNYGLTSHMQTLHAIGMWPSSPQSLMQ